MPTDPASIPDHAAKAAYDAQASLTAEQFNANGGIPEAIAAALDALFTDEPVKVKTYGFTIDTIRPTDCLAAVLARANAPRGWT